MENYYTFTYGWIIFLHFFVKNYIFFHNLYMKKSVDKSCFLTSKMMLLTQKKFFFEFFRFFKFSVVKIFSNFDQKSVIFSIFYPFFKKKFLMSLKTNNKILLFLSQQNVRDVHSSYVKRF